MASARTLASSHKGKGRSTAAEVEASTIESSVAEDGKEIPNMEYSRDMAFTQKVEIVTSST